MLPNVPRSPSFLPPGQAIALPEADRAVFAAIAADDPEALRAALAAGGNAQAQDVRQIIADQDAWVDKVTPLTDAIRRPQAVALELVDALLDAGATPRQVDADHSPLRLAAQQQRWDLVGRLLEACPPPHFVGDQEVRQDVLRAALHAAQTGLLKRLVNAGWAVNANPDQDGWLHQFVRAMAHRPALPDGWTATLDLMVDVDRNGLNAPRTNHQGNTPVTLAIASGWPELVDALLQRGADPNRPVRQEVADDFQQPAVMIWEDQGITPLHRAASEDRAGICRVLLAHGADPHRRADTPWTRQEAQAIWSQREAPLPDTDRSPLTPLDTAQRNGAFAAAAVLEQVLLRATAGTTPSVEDHVSPVRQRQRL